MNNPQAVEALKSILRDLVRWNDQYGKGGYMEASIVNGCMMASNDYWERSDDTGVDVHYRLDEFLNDEEATS